MIIADLLSFAAVALAGLYRFDTAVAALVIISEHRICKQYPILPRPQYGLLGYLIHFLMDCKICFLFCDSRWYIQLQIFATSAAELLVNRPTRQNPLGPLAPVAASLKGSLGPCGE